MDKSAVIQILFTTFALIVTYVAAIRGAERGARLSELATISREVRERAEEQKRQTQQIKAIRLLLALEIRQNIIDLTWLWERLTETLGEEQESYYFQAGEVYYDPERYEWLEARQRFLALHLPDWTHRCWHGQQSSYLVSVALKQLEIRQISRHHSQLDRLTKIKNMLAESALRRAGTSGGSVASPALTSFDEDASRLWKEFVSVSAETLVRGNPLNDDLEKAGVEPLPAVATDALIPGSRLPSLIEADSALAVNRSAQLAQTNRT